MSESHIPSVPSAIRSRIMKAVPRAGTSPEILLRRALHATGSRYRKDFPIRTRRGITRADVAFTRWRVAVFVDGCFWHLCPLHGQIPATNVGFWKPKLEGNVIRDQEHTRALEEAGWLVVRVWEHEPVESAVAAVQAAVESRRKFN